MGNGGVPHFVRNTQEQPLEADEAHVLRVPTVPEREEIERIEVAPKERERIIQAAHDGVKRRDMCKHLGKGKQYYDIVKQVLDEEGL
jgi:hypothetical protein